MIELIIIASVSSLAIGILFFQGKTNQKKFENEVSGLREEIELKREQSAKFSIMENTNISLKNDIEILNENIDDLKNEITKKEVVIAEVNKDQESTVSKLNDAHKQSQKLIDEVNVLKKSMDKKNVELFEHITAIKENEFTLQQKEELHKNNIKSIADENKRLANKITELNSEIKNLKENIVSYQTKMEETTSKMIDSNTKNTTLTANLEAQQSNHKKLKEAFDEQTKKFELKVGEIMQTALDFKLKKFDESSMKSLDETLKPFRENLEQFRKKVEDTQESSTKKFAELSKEIEQVTKAGIHISKEAENLTQALKGKKQTQGSWGEMILETVLEYSGLLKGVHFKTQQSYKDESGDIKRPDVVINLPQNRSMIIDSKVSLNDYDRYIRAETDEERLIASKGVAKAFRDQIDNLDSKDYSHYKIGTLQYVFMFVPVEGAFSLAVQEDPSLYEYALKKHIAIVNPSTLTVSLRTIYLYWQSEQSNTLAIKLFDEAGKLYDKMHTFTESFAKIGTQLQTVNKTYEHATKQLSEGSGNLMGRVEKLKKLGARTSKSLSNSKIEYQDFDVNDVEVEIMDDSSPLFIEEETKS